MISRVNQLDALYARVPNINCKGLCYETCGPIIPMAGAERQRTGLPTINFHDDQCAALTVENRCGIHPERPLICRLYGTVEDFRCEFGCKPDTYLTSAEGRKLIRESQEI
jgi:uncharacterized protein